jgi:hypothetical protein
MVIFHSYVKLPEGTSMKCGREKEVLKPADLGLDWFWDFLVFPFGGFFGKYKYP